MKPILYFSLSIAIILLALGGCGNSQPDPDITTVFIAHKNQNSNCELDGQRGATTRCADFLEGAQIKIYNSREDLLADKNVANTLITSNDGTVSIKHNKDKILWFNITKDSLSSYFSGIKSNRLYSAATFTDEETEKRKSSYCAVYGGTVGIRMVAVIMIEVPVKLKIKVFKKGAIQPNKSVKLFISETDRNNNKIYTINDLILKNKATGFDQGPVLTNSEGVAEFKYLLPYKFWITVDDSIPLPSTTNGKLAPNPDLTNYLEVGMP